MSNWFWVLYWLIVFSAIVISVLVLVKTKKASDFLAVLFTAIVPAFCVVLICMETDSNMYRMLYLMTMPIIRLTMPVFTLFDWVFPYFLLFHTDGTMEFNFALNQIQTGTVIGIIILISHVILALLLIISIIKMVRLSRTAPKPIQQK